MKTYYVYVTQTYLRADMLSIGRTTREFSNRKNYLVQNAAKVAQLRNKIWKKKLQNSYKNRKKITQQLQKKGVS